MELQLGIKGGIGASLSESAVLKFSSELPGEAAPSPSSNPLDPLV